MDKVTHTERSLDWLKVAKSAGKHGIRFRTNATLVDFLNEVSTPSPDSAESMREALEKCRDQFAFYAREHYAAGKSQKGDTNTRFADLCIAALQESAR